MLHCYCSMGRGGSPPASHRLALLITSPVRCTAGSSLKAPTTACTKLGTRRLASATCHNQGLRKGSTRGLLALSPTPQDLMSVHDHDAHQEL